MPLDRYSTADRWLLIPELEAITYRSRQTESTFTDYAVAFAKKNPPSRTLDSNLRATTAEWILWRDLLEDANVPTPKVYDVIRQTDGTDWVIEAIRVVLMDNAYHCDCRRLVTATA